MNGHWNENFASIETPKIFAALVELTKSGSIESASEGRADRKFEGISKNEEGIENGREIAA